MVFDATPSQAVIQRELPAVTIAATVVTPVDQAPFAGVLAYVAYVPVAAITGANTNTRRLRLINKGQGGAGTTVMAELEFDSGVNAAADVAKAIPNSGTAASLVVAAGDILAIESAAIGTGLADPGGLVVVSLTRQL